MRHLWIRATIIGLVTTIGAGTDAFGQTTPVKVFVEARPTATGADEKAQKERQNAIDTAKDLVDWLKALRGDAAKSIELVADASTADVVIAVLGRRQAMMGPKNIDYSLQVGRGTVDLVWSDSGGVWKQAAGTFADQIGVWAMEDAEPIKAVAARKAASGASRAIGLGDIVETRWTTAVARELKTLGNEGLAAAVPPALAMIGSKEKRVRQIGEFYLKELTGQKFGTDRAKWDTWWAAHPAARPQ